MSAAAELQTLLRFLAQDAKVPLATAMSKVRDLQAASLATPPSIAAAPLADLKAVFADDQLAKQVHNAAKRGEKRKAAGEDGASSSPSKKRKVGASEGALQSAEQTPQQLEAALALPTTDASEETVAQTVVFTNRAPLYMAFAVTLLKYTMPQQPLSSRLSLAQAYISITSRARAVNLGIESGKSAEEEGWGKGQPSVKIMGVEVRILRRYGYEWREVESATTAEGADAAEAETGSKEDTVSYDKEAMSEEPALWGLDLEALKKSGDSSASAANSAGGALPIYTPQSARSYMMKAFASPASSGVGPAKASKSKQQAEEKERNLGMLLFAIDKVFESWSKVLDGAELDKRVWSWYVQVRPSVADGVDGWGGKNVVKLGDILHLRRKAGTH